MIKDLRIIDSSMGIAGGSFKSRIFRNDGTDEISVCLKNLSLADYAEKCIEHFNSMPDDMIDKICRSIAEYSTKEYENIRDILEYCPVFELVVDTPENDEINYLAEGADDRGEIIGIVVKNSRLVYVGVDYGDYL